MIAIVHPQFYGVHGIARYIESFLTNLPSGSPPVILITGEPADAVRSFAGVEIIHVPLAADRYAARGGLTRWGLAVRARLLRLYAEGRVRCVNLHIPPLIPALLLPSRIPTVLTAHTTYLGMSGRFYPQCYFRSQWSPASLAVKTWMERRILARARKVITLTEQGRAEIERYGYKGPVAVIANGADTRHFVPDPSVPKDVDVLFAGRIERRKGSRSMVDICRALVAARPSIRIVIVGYGEDFDWVRAGLESLSAVHLTGKISFEQMRDYYKRSRTYVSTSYYEGLPGTCLEAMAMGLPTVVWDFLFYRGLVLDGQTGFVVEPNDLKAMCSKVLELLDDSATAGRFGTAGRELLQSGYGWQSLAPRILDELVSVT